MIIGIIYLLLIIIITFILIFVLQNSYFVMGDNRNGSTDSRTCFISCNDLNNEYITSNDIQGVVYFDLGYFNFKNLSFRHELLGIDTFPKFFNIK